MFRSKILDNTTSARSYHEYDGHNAPTAPEPSLDPISSQITTLDASRPTLVASNHSTFDASVSSSSSGDVFSRRYNICRNHIQAATSLQSLYLPISVFVKCSEHNTPAAHKMALFASRLEEYVSPQVGVQAYREGLRSSALRSFENYWAIEVLEHRYPGPPYEPPSPDKLVTSRGFLRLSTAPPTPSDPFRGINLAVFLGALFTNGIFTGSDVHAALHILEEAADDLVQSNSASNPENLMAFMSTAYHHLFCTAGPGICAGEWKEQTDVLVSKWMQDAGEESDGQTLVSELLKLLEHWDAI
ncbi:hypothetical protein FB45DRAFT_1004536 [Roridomyces roridus]|uniref:Uncharacterized protein n=1 Tax=Roridomyces roridus TaxID=1738132 RepID=A0AAD7BP92_9AGAR|nr:hypothetical protein FB45DRAFT_1004536 [Roridomyces roridus]